ncbi:unnamed protein product [Macrosiphum euphorbiae]|uniref:HAT C-terminal dimerisation domain-containing protein n=1 Tax=Macrosiphum euphorbiae TaxID=13131 RepID=A0AAV0WKX0_9HEMI|nr:unnamed protein product [Macrosiphum euphorbiae]
MNLIWPQGVEHNNVLLLVSDAAPYMMAKHSFDGLPNTIETTDIVNFKYSPANSVDAERSYSAYKNILSDRRRSLKFENISKIIVIQCNLNI